MKPRSYGCSFGAGPAGWVGGTLERPVLNRSCSDCGKPMAARSNGITRAAESDSPTRQETSAFLAARVSPCPSSSDSRPHREFCTGHELGRPSPRSSEDPDKAVLDCRERARRVFGRCTNWLRRGPDRVSLSPPEFHGPSRARRGLDLAQGGSRLRRALTANGRENPARLRKSPTRHSPILLVRGPA